MATHIVLLRAVNVGGTSKLAMADLKAMCEAAGFENVQTYIASGNVVLNSSLTPVQIKSALESRLADHVGKPVSVFVISPDEMAAIRDANPHVDAPGNRVLVTFLGMDVPTNALEDVRHQTDEAIVSGDQVLYIYFQNGVGRSKLVIPAAKSGTARNMNTVAKLAEMAAARQD